MLRKKILAPAALALALLGALQAAPRAQGAPEAAWQSGAQRFDGIYAGPSGRPPSEAGGAGSLGSLNNHEGADRGALTAPAATAAWAKTKDGERDPWADRQDFGIVSIGIFGLALLAVQAFVKNIFWATVIATAIVAGYFLLSAIGL